MNLPIIPFPTSFAVMCFSGSFGFPGILGKEGFPGRSIFPSGFKTSSGLLPEGTFGNLCSSGINTLGTMISEGSLM